MKITIHIVTQGSNTHATITMIVNKASVEYDATYRNCKVSVDDYRDVSITCDNGEAKEWNTSCKAGVYSYYDVFVLRVE